MTKKQDDVHSSAWYLSRSNQNRQLQGKYSRESNKPSNPVRIRQDRNLIRSNYTTFIKQWTPRNLRPSKRSALRSLCVNPIKGVISRLAAKTLSFVCPKMLSETMYSVTRRYDQALNSTRSERLFENFWCRPFFDRFESHRQLMIIGSYFPLYLINCHQPRCELATPLAGIRFAQ